MSLMRKVSETLIAPCCAAALLDLDESSLRKGCAGTENLTQVRHGSGKRQRIHFIPEEIISLKSGWIEAARKTNGNVRNVLRLVS